MAAKICLCARYFLSSETLQWTVINVISNWLRLIDPRLWHRQNSDHLLHVYEQSSQLSASLFIVWSWKRFRNFTDWFDFTIFRSSAGSRGACSIQLNPPSPSLRCCFHHCIKITVYNYRLTEYCYPFFQSYISIVQFAEDHELVGHCPPDSLLGPCPWNLLEVCCPPDL